MSYEKVTVIIFQPWQAVKDDSRKPRERHVRAQFGKPWSMLPSTIRVICPISASSFFRIGLHQETRSQFV
jgi:hypothetical protein